MKINKKYVLGSALALALSVNFISPSYADEIQASNPSLEEKASNAVENTDDKNQDNISEENPSENPTSSSNEESKAEESQDSKKTNSDEEKRGVYPVRASVKNRKISDWVKPESTISIIEDGKVIREESISNNTTSNYREIMGVSLLPNKSYQIEVKDKNNKTYAKGSFRTPKDHTYTRLATNLELLENQNRKVIDLNFKKRDDEGNILPFYKAGDYHLFINGEYIGSNNSRIYRDFPANVGETYNIEIRDARDKNDSKLLAVASFTLREEDGHSLDIILKDPKDSGKITEEDTSKDENQTKPESEDNKGKTDENKDGKDKDGKDKASDENKEEGKDQESSQENQNSEESSKSQEDKIFDSKEEAIDAAKKALENNKDYDKFEIYKNQDGKYYFKLAKKDDPQVQKVRTGKNSTKSRTLTNPISKKANNVKKARNTKANVKTGVKSVAGIVGLLAASVGGFFFIKKNK